LSYKSADRTTIAFVLLCLALVAVPVGAVLLARRLVTADIRGILGDFWFSLLLFGTLLSFSAAVLLVGISIVWDRTSELFAKLGQKKPSEQRRWAGGAISASTSFVVSATGYAVSAQLSTDPLTRFYVSLSLFVASAALTVL